MGIVKFKKTRCALPPRQQQRLLPTFISSEILRRAVRQCIVHVECFSSGHGGGLILVAWWYVQHSCSVPESLSVLVPKLQLVIDNQSFTSWLGHIYSVSMLSMILLSSSLSKSRSDFFGSSASDACILSATFCSAAVNEGSIPLGSTTR